MRGAARTPRRGGPAVELRPERVHATFLFPIVVLLFVLQPVVATLFAAATELLVVPLGITLLVGIWSLEPGPRWKRFGLAVFAALLVTLALHTFTPVPDARWFVLATIALYLLGAACVALGVRWLFGLHEITVQTLLASVSTFLLLGVLFALLCLGLFQLDPG